MKEEIQASSEFKLVEDGKHEGRILDYEIREIENKDYVYIDIKLSVEDKDDEGNYIYTYTDKEDGTEQVLSLFIGFNKNLKANSYLGEMLTDIGFELIEGETFDYDDIKGVQVVYMTQQKEVFSKKQNKTVKVAEILRGTIKKA